MSDLGIVTTSDVCALAEIVKAAHAGNRVARVDADSFITRGTARSVGNESGSFATDRDDVRAAYLRVTLECGIDAYWPIAELLPEIKAGTFIANVRD